MPVLELANFSVQRAGATLLHDISLTVERGECVGVFGKTGSGKTTLVRAIIGMLPKGTSARGNLMLDNVPLLEFDDAARRERAGASLSAIPEDTDTAFDGLEAVGLQVLDLAGMRSRMGQGPKRDLLLETLSALGAIDPETVFRRPPRELPLGLLRQAALATALLRKPRCLIVEHIGAHIGAVAQRKTLQLLAERRAADGLSVLLLESDPTTLRHAASRVHVLEAGRLTTASPATNLFEPGTPSPLLLAHQAYATPLGTLPLDPAAPQSEGGAPHLRVRRVSKKFRGHEPSGRLFSEPRPHWAVAGVSFRVARGETLGIIGHSGAGKTTLLRSILCIDPPSAGHVTVEGIDLAELGAHDLRRFRARMQGSLRNVASSLNPLLSVRDIIGEPLWIHRPDLDRPAQEERIRAIVERVGLSLELLARKPQELSYGERKLTGLGRALISNPTLVAYDEPVEGLDPFARSRVLDLVQRRRVELGNAALLVSHDLGAIRAVTTHTAVMYRGRLVEIAPTETLFDRRSHPYTREFLGAARGSGAPRRALQVVAEAPGDSGASRPVGCRFADACPRVEPLCRDKRPRLSALSGAHRVACHFPIVGADVGAD